MENHKSLAQFFGTDHVDFERVDPSRYVHMIIDVQAIYCKRNALGSRHTEYVAGKIARIKPLAEEFGIRSMIVYVDVKDGGIDKAGGGLYKIKFNPDTDIPCRKRGTSAFAKGNAEELLNDMDVRHLIVSGFNANACVFETVRHALAKEFNVLLLSDCLGQGTYHQSKAARDSVKKSIGGLCDLGALVTQSKNLFEFLETVVPR